MSAFFKGKNKLANPSNKITDKEQKLLGNLAAKLLALKILLRAIDNMKSILETGTQVQSNER